MVAALTHWTTLWTTKGASRSRSSEKRSMIRSFSKHMKKPAPCRGTGGMRFIIPGRSGRLGLHRRYVQQAFPKSRTAAAPRIQLWPGSRATAVIPSERMVPFMVGERARWRVRHARLLAPAQEALMPSHPKAAKARMENHHSHGMWMISSASSGFHFRRMPKPPWTISVDGK